MSKESRESLAICGIGCRFPGGANNPESFWKMLIDGVSAISEVPKDRWNLDSYYSTNSQIPGKMITKWGGFLNDIELFDPRFFGISPREALRMDPQQRWLLEVAWEAMEDAGQSPDKIAGTNTGVFIGISSNDYANIQMKGRGDVDVHTNSGSTLSIASGRISYLLDLKGPSASVDTACSSSLVAVNLACQSIWNGQCEYALAGGVNALLTPDSSIGFSKASMLSPTGHCYTFDDRANGYVRGEGAGVIFIKPLKKAIKDNDPIYAVIKAAVVNQDGKTNAMTVPGQFSQEAMLRYAYDQAKISPNNVCYMEAHGTGTPVGDPIEVLALGNVISEGRTENEKCTIGSVKTNIGHLESASGIAGVIKAALVLKNKTVPPNLNFENPNPNIPFDELKLHVPTEVEPLQNGKGPRIAAVNSFGFGGTNAHIVMSEVESKNGKKKRSSGKKIKRPFLLPISARNNESLKQYATAYGDFIKNNDADLNDITNTAGLRKAHHDHRIVVFGKNKNDISDRINSYLSNKSSSGLIIGKPNTEDSNEIAFVFTGQGPQWWGMGRELLKKEPIFKDVIEKCDKLLSQYTSWSLIEELTRDEETTKIGDTEIAQPAIFALQIGLAELWKSFGISPSAVVGHSVGEVAAAYIAGVYTLEDAIKIIYQRSRLQETTRGNGRMVAVAISWKEAKELIEGHEDHVAITAVNSSGMVTLAGDTKEIESLVAPLEKEQIFVRWLKVDFAFHTHQMTPIKNELLECLSDINPMSSKIPFYSTVTGDVLDGKKLDGLYWWQNVRDCVLFAPAMEQLIANGFNSFLELGPHPSLASSISECLSASKIKGTVLPSIRRNEPEQEQILTSLATLYANGSNLNWENVNGGKYSFVRLPSYPWQNEKYWLESEISRDYRLSGPGHPLLGKKTSNACAIWEGEIDPRALNYLNDHRLRDSIVYPASAYVEMALGIISEIFPDESYVAEEIKFKKALFISEKNALTIQFHFDDSDGSFKIYGSESPSENNWELHAEGRIQKLLPTPLDKPDFNSLKNKLTEIVEHEKIYEDFHDAGYQFGPNFSEIQTTWRVPNEALAEIIVPEEIDLERENYQFHPAILDACFQCIKGAQEFIEGREASENFFLPVGLERIKLYKKPTKHLWSHATLEQNDGEIVIGDIKVFDDNGEPVADIKGFRAQRVDQTESKSKSDLDNCLYKFQWHPVRVQGKGVKHHGSAEIQSPLEIADTLNTVGLNLAAEYDITKYSKVFAPKVESLAFHYILNCFAELGWKPSIGEIFSTSEFLKNHGIISAHERLTRAYLNALLEEGVLAKSSNDSWEVIALPESSRHEEMYETLKKDYPNSKAELGLQRNCGIVLPGVLNGTTDPLQIIFSAESPSLLEQFYQETPDCLTFNLIIKNALDSLLKKFPKISKLKILEVGAGTGSMTEAILDIFPKDQTSYVFSDISPLFIAQAMKKFKDQKFVEYKTFDLEKSPEEQGFELESFDIVLGTNVLHATSDLKHTLENIKKVMAPEGILLFLEITKPRKTLDNVFGLLKGWWQFTDTDLRPSSAIISTDQWTNLLGECGYAEPISVVNTDGSHDANQTLFISQKPAQVEFADEKVDKIKAELNNDFWLIFGDQEELGKSLATNLFEQTGSASSIINVGESFKKINEKSYQIRPGNVDDMKQLFSELNSSEKKLRGVIHLWNLDQPHYQDTTTEILENAQELGCMSILNLAQNLVQSEYEEKPRVWIITRGAQGVGEDKGPITIAGTPVTGFIRVANNEHEDFKFTTIDLDYDFQEGDIDALSNEITSNDPELEIAYRSGTRYVNRLMRPTKSELPIQTKEAVKENSIIPYRLEVPTQGILNNFILKETSHREVGDTEIEIQVKSAGLNFRDVMKAMGIYPGESDDLNWYGDECSGTVVSVGKDVKNFNEGDDVVAMIPYCFRAYATIDESLVFKKSKHISFDEAATLPIVFLTAHYALNRLAHLQEGEKVLIHAGAGGVGQAAIQVAQLANAEIFATAGSPEKREFLKKIGVHHVMDSRSLKFADEIMEITDGKGVDVILNSLAGDFIPKSISVLASYGRFLEIGKIDIYQNSKMGLEPFQRNLSYFAIDLAKHLEERPKFVATMLGEISALFDQKKLKPLPLTSFSINEAADAFRYMAQAKHIGKVVLSLEQESITISPSSDRKKLFKKDATYLITGGLGGFGLEVAKWMVDCGAGNLLLMSRRGATTDEAIDGIAEIERKGAKVVAVKADVTNGDDIKRIINQIKTEMPPLKGIFHAAMVLDDAFVVQLDPERFKKVLRPKMSGAWHLHTHTLDIALDHFVMFSSASSIIGGAGQGNYSAANYFLDAMAHFRNSIGLPALTINWGALSGAGFVARNEKVAKYLDHLGLQSFSPEEALDIFAEVLPHNPIQIAISRVDWKALAKMNPSAANATTYSLMANTISDDGTASGNSSSFKPKVLAAPMDERQGMLEDYICDQVAQVFGTTADNVDRETALTKIGLDSLMAIELMNRLESNLGISLPMGKFLQGPNIIQLSESVLELINNSDGEDQSTSVVENSSSDNIVKEIPQEFPLSYGQQGLWFLHRLAPDSTAYHFVFGSKFSPKINQEVVEKVFDTLLERHPALKSRFSLKNGQLTQIIDDSIKFSLNKYDARNWSKEKLNSVVADEGKRSINLETGPLFRFTAFDLNDKEDLILITVHHIIFDAWSLAVLLDELFQLYFSNLAGTSHSLKPAKSNYAEFVKWQDKIANGPEGERHWHYWKEKLSGTLPILNLPLDRPRPAVQQLRGAMCPFKINSETTRKITELAKQEGATLYMSLLAAFQSLLHYYTGQDDIIVGSPMSARTKPEFNNVIGFFANPVAIRSKFEEDASYRSILNQVKDSVVEAMEHQDYPFLNLVKRLGIPQDPSTSPIFQVQFAMEKSKSVDQKGMAVFAIGQEGVKLDLGGLTMESIDIHQRDAQFEITLLVEEAMNSIFAAFEYNTDLFDADTMESMAQRYQLILENIVSDPDKNLSDISMLTNIEKENIFSKWNHTQTDSSDAKCVHDLFNDQVAKSPEATAVTSAGRAYSYSELDKKSNGVAQKLAELNIGPDVPVIIFLDRSVDMPAGVLGVLKSGGCYVPLDPVFPKYRLQLVIDDIKPKVILTESSLESELPEGDWQTLFIDNIKESDNAPTNSKLSSENLAYIIYTSGSTGKPKGVEIPHRAVVNFLTSMQQSPGITSNNKLLAVTTLSFDISVLELLVPLITGAEVVIASKSECADGHRLISLLEEFDIDVMQATPATWKLLFDSGWTGKDDLKVLCGGENLPKELADRLLNNSAEVWNLYGPTETTIWSAINKLNLDDKSVSVGRPINNTTIYILDDEGSAVAPGIVGELFIGGSGLALGYFNRPELTSKKFKNVSIENDTKERLYSTGDLARYGKDGSIYVIGRSDNQIKLRGYRIELGEIESELVSHDDIKEVVVIKRDDLVGGSRLIAYFIPAIENENLVNELRNLTTDRLPEYMRPSAYVKLESFPLTDNNKIDIKSLPKPTIDRDDLSSAFISSQSPTEKVLCDIFNRVFENDQIGIYDNFFEIGGNSLTAVQIVTEVSSAFNRNVPVESFMRNPTIESLANYLDQSSLEYHPIDAETNGHGNSEDIEFDLVGDYLSVEFAGNNEKEESSPKIDSAALAYLPDSFVALTGLNKNEIIQTWFKGEPILGNVYKTSFGNIGILMLPRLGVELYKNNEGLKKSVLRAMEIAAEMGAKTISLTGLIPSATNYGKDVNEWVNGREDLPAITTGHATTTATVVLNIEQILTKADRKISNEKIAVIGLGSIGHSTLRLMLKVLPHPKEIILCDLYQKLDVLHSIQKEIVDDIGYEGIVRTEATRGKLPEAVYEASLVIGAANVPNILDIKRLQPGTIIVDDSFPPCFNTIDAIRRIEDQHDILFTTAGNLRLDDEIEETIFLPNGLEEFLDNNSGNSRLKALISRDPNEITGCILSSILTGMESEIRPTLGTVKLEDSIEHYNFLKANDLQAANLQCEHYRISEESVEKFKTIISQHIEPSETVASIN